MSSVCLTVLTCINVSRGKQQDLKARVDQWQVTVHQRQKINTLKKTRDTLSQENVTSESQTDSTSISTTTHRTGRLEIGNLSSLVASDPLLAPPNAVLPPCPPYHAGLIFPVTHLQSFTWTRTASTIVIPKGDISLNTTSSRPINRS